METKVITGPWGTLRAQGKAGLSIKHRREKHLQEQYSGLTIVNGEIIQVIDVRYYNTKPMGSACVWIQTGFASLYEGSGESRETGSPREKIAVRRAFCAAGFDFNSNLAISIEDMITGAMRAMGYSYVKIINAHP